MQQDMLGDEIVLGKKYLAEQAATLLRFAKVTSDPDVAAGLLAKAADLSSRSNAAPDVSPHAPEVEPSYIVAKSVQSKSRRA